MILCKVVVKSAENPYKVWRLMHIHVQESIFSLLWKAITRSIFNTTAFLKAFNFFSILTEMNWRFYLSKYVFIPNIAFKSSIFFLLLFIKPLPPCHDSQESMQVYKQHCKIAEEYHEVKKEIALLEERKWVTFPHCLLLYILLVKSHSKCEGLRWYFVTLFLCMTATVQHNGPLVGINLDQ